MQDHNRNLNQLNTAATTEQWKRIGIHPHHGICIPLFSLHSCTSAGIGEFPDLIPLIDRCRTMGLDTIQLLPLNDTGPNTSPYSAISAYALNPMHLGLANLPDLHRDDRLIALLKELRRLSKTDRVEYSRIRPLRELFLKDYFRLQAEEILASEDYIIFLKSNPWLKGYALFKALKSQSDWQSWSSWPDDIRDCSPLHCERLEKKIEPDISYHCFLQFFCFKQMTQVKQHADSAGIFLKGDIPILIDRESADLWLHGSLFDMTLTAGAPPDAYSEIGQNWGFPLYNWTEMEKKDNAWWKERLAYASNFYHIYRIDHIVGFFRIWGIPEGAPATEGHFVPNDPGAALRQGKKLMKMMIDASPMLPIGEDLGVVPDEVRSELKNLGICGTKVMRWERNWKGDHEFIKPENYSPLSVTTVSTHDSSPLSLWWLQNSEEARDYCLSQGWDYQTPLSPEYRFALLYTSHHTASLFHINLLQEYLAFIPEFVHNNPEDQRINVPGIISEKNWTYRFRPSIEEIAESEELARLIKDLKA